MIATELRTALAAELPALFEVEAEPRPDGSVRLFTPFRYDDGTMAVIFVVRRDEEYVLSDYGETLGWLWVRTGGGELSAKQEVSAGYGVPVRAGAARLPGRADRNRAGATARRRWRRRYSGWGWPWCG